MCVALTRQQSGYQLLSLDVTQPEKPLLGKRAGVPSRFGLELTYPWRVKVIPGLEAVTLRGTAPCSAGQSFRGDLAAVTRWNSIGVSIVDFFDVTGPARTPTPTNLDYGPCYLGVKTLSISPDTVAPPQGTGAIQAFGAAQGIATVPHSTGLNAYVAVSEVGLMAADVGMNIPTPPVSDG